MPYPLLLRKNGMGLYMYSFCVPMPSRVETRTFCPRLLKRVNDSPQPKIISSCCSSKVAARRRERSLARRTKENGMGVMKAVSYTHLRAHETPEHLVCRL